MNGAWVVFRREVGQYFASPIAYLIAAALLLVTGLYFNADLTFSVGTKPAEPALIPLLLSFAMVFCAPLLTMRLLAEERREGTLELLLTAPVSDGAIVLGKFLSAWFYYTILLALTFIYQIILVSITQPDMGHTMAAYIGIWLYGGATLAVGILFSAITENQIVAAFLSIALLFILWMGELIGQIITNLELAEVVRQLTLIGHFTSSFAVGLIRAEDIAYYAGITALMLFIAIRVVESNRWR